MVLIEESVILFVIISEESVILFVKILRTGLSFLDFMFYRALFTERNYAKLFLKIEFRGVNQVRICLFICFFWLVSFYARCNLLLCLKTVCDWMLYQIYLWFIDLGHSLYYISDAFYLVFWCAIICSLLISNLVLWWVYLSRACKTYWELSTTSDFHGKQCCWSSC